MALDRSQLQRDIEAAMQRQMPDDPLSAGSRQFAADLAAAIDSYVHDADVTGVKVKDHEDRTLNQTGHGSVT